MSSEFKYGVIQRHLLVCYKRCASFHPLGSKLRMKHIQVIETSSSVTDPVNLILRDQFEVKSAPLSPSTVYSPLSSNPTFQIDCSKTLVRGNSNTLLKTLGVCLKGSINFESSPGPTGTPNTTNVYPAAGGQKLTYSCELIHPFTGDTILKVTHHDEC